MDWTDVVLDYQKVVSDLTSSEIRVLETWLRPYTESVPDGRSIKALERAHHRDVCVKGKSRCDDSLRKWRRRQGLVTSDMDKTGLFISSCGIPFDSLCPDMSDPQLSKDSILSWISDLTRVPEDIAVEKAKDVHAEPSPAVGEAIDMPTSKTSEQSSLVPETSAAVSTLSPPAAPSNAPPFSGSSLVDKRLYPTIESHLADSRFQFGIPSVLHITSFYCFIGSSFGNVVMYSLSNSVAVRTFKPTNQDVRIGAVTAIDAMMNGLDGVLCTGHRSGAIFVYDTSTGAMLKHFNTHRAAISTLCSISGRGLLSADVSGQLYLNALRQGVFQTNVQSQLQFDGQGLPFGTSSTCKLARYGIKVVVLSRPGGFLLCAVEPRMQVIDVCDAPSSVTGSPAPSSDDSSLGKGTEVPLVALRDGDPPLLALILLSSKTVVLYQLHVESSSMAPAVSMTPTVTVQCIQMQVQQVKVLPSDLKRAVWVNDSVLLLLSASCIYVCDPFTGEIVSVHETLQSAQLTDAVLMSSSNVLVLTPTSVFGCRLLSWVEQIMVLVHAKQYLDAVVLAGRMYRSLVPFAVGMYRNAERKQEQCRGPFSSLSASIVQQYLAYCLTESLSDSQNAVLSALFDLLVTCRYHPLLFSAVFGSAVPDGANVRPFYASFFGKLVAIVAADESFKSPAPLECLQASLDYVPPADSYLLLQRLGSELSASDLTLLSGRCLQKLHWGSFFLCYRHSSQDPSPAIDACLAFVSNIGAAGQPVDDTTVPQLTDMRRYLFEFIDFALRNSTMSFRLRLIDGLLQPLMTGRPSRLSIMFELDYEQTIKLVGVILFEVSSLISFTEADVGSLGKKKSAVEYFAWVRQHLLDSLVVSAMNLDVDPFLPLRDKSNVRNLTSLYVLIIAVASSSFGSSLMFNADVFHRCIAGVFHAAHLSVQEKEQMVIRLLDASVSAGLTLNYEKILRLAEVSRMYQVRAHVLVITKKYAEAIHSYLHVLKKSSSSSAVRSSSLPNTEEDHSLHVATALFEFLENSIAADPKNGGLRDAIVENLQTLYAIDPSSCQRMFNQLFSGKPDFVVEVHEVPALQFYFLKEWIKTQRDDDLFEVGAPPSVVSICETYIHLMCRFEKDRVLPFLMRHSAYRLEVCIEFCASCSVRDAAAYLLQKTGDVMTATKHLLTEVAELFDRALHSMEKSSVDDFDLDRGRIVRFMDQVIDVVARSYSSARDMDIQNAWFFVLDEIIHARRKFLHQLDVIHQSSASHITDKSPAAVQEQLLLQTAFCEDCLQLLGSCIENSLSTMVRYVPIQSVLQKVIHEHGRDAVRLFRRTLIFMMDRYQFERSVTASVRRMMASDCLDLFDQEVIVSNHALDHQHITQQELETQKDRKTKTRTFVSFRRPVESKDDAAGVDDELRRSKKHANNEPLSVGHVHRAPTEVFTRPTVKKIRLGFPIVECELDFDKVMRSMESVPSPLQEDVGTDSESEDQGPRSLLVRSDGADEY